MKLDLGSCSCRVWDFNEISCAHALAILRKLNVDSYSYVSMYYHSITLSSTYTGCVRPVGVHLDWRVVDDKTKVLPPIIKHQTGRPKKQRILSIGESTNSSRCSCCNCKRHNCRTCKLGLTNG